MELEAEAQFDIHAEIQNELRIRLQGGQ